LLASGRLDGRRVGIVCNPASIDHELRHIADRLVRDPKTTLAAIFGPQHGFRSDVQENMIETGHARDALRRVAGVFALQRDAASRPPRCCATSTSWSSICRDVGTRIYTYIYTMANCLVAAKKHGITVIVCDRPNRSAAPRFEGPMLVRGFESFVGLYPLPMRHGMTIGELARLFNEAFGHRRRSRGRRDGGLDPRHVLRRGRDSVRCCRRRTSRARFGDRLSRHRAVRRTNVSEGRGTTRPFELLGAPWWMRSASPMA